MKAITLSALRAKMKFYFDAVTKNKEIIVIPRNNRDDDAIVIMSIGEYNALKETEYLLASKANRYRLKESMIQLAAEDTIAYTLPEETKENEG